MSLRFIQKDQILQEATNVIGKAISLNGYEKIPEEAENGFHNDTADQIMRMREIYDEMSDYLKAIFCGTICVVARGCNNYLWTSITVGKNIYPKRYIF